MSLRFPFILSPSAHMHLLQEAFPDLSSFGVSQGSHNALCFLSALSTSAYRHSSPRL